MASLLWADGYSVGDGATQNLWQGPPRFIGCGIGILGGVEVQPGALGILFQQSLALQASSYTSANQLNEVLQLTLIRRSDSPKPGRSIVVLDVDAIKDQDVKVNKVN